MQNDELEIDPLWYLHDEFTVEQAAALIAGYDPGYIARCRNDTNFEGQFPKIYAAQTALINAINGRRLKATIRRNAHIQGWDESPSEDERLRRLEFIDDGWATQGRDYSKLKVAFCESPDWALTTILLDNVRAWLTSRGVRAGFFFPTATGASGYLERDNPRYAPKLAAAVRAWQAVTDPNGKHPKQALEKWLREHAADFDLTDDDGKLNEQGIDECAKVANWQPGGGAPKTPAK